MEVTIKENPTWIYYISENAEKLDEHRCGKWMYFFKNLEIAKRICFDAVSRGVVSEAKHSNAEDGVCCFYLNCDNVSEHKQTIQFFLDNGLIQKTKSGRLYNISFKLDDQTRAGQYDKDFSSDIKLGNFIDLDTGKWLI